MRKLELLPVATTRSQGTAVRDVASIIAYASRTGTKRNLDGLRARGWRLLVSATGVLRHEGFQYGLDNGAWTAFQQGRPFDVTRFMKALWTLGRDADFVVVPDIVAGGVRSLEFSLTWLRTVLCMTEIALIAVQDGMQVDDVRPLLNRNVGVFVGGDPRTDWKERTTPAWASACRSAGAWCHVGRVNSQRRINLCASSGATSFDGTSATKYAVELPKLHRAVAQQHLLLETK
jgi:hypothetical protein